MKIEKIEIPIIEETEINFSDIQNKCQVDLSEVIERQPIALSKGFYQYKNYTNPIPLVSYGNFMCIVGASKSMKSQLKKAFVSAYIGGEKNNYFNELSGHRGNDKFVLDFDTEQGKFHAQRVFRTTIEMVGKKYENYIPFALRSLSANERLQFIEWVLYESDYKNNIGMVSIDGVADLLDNVNDLEKSNEITGKLMKWTEEKNCAMITVLHKNFGTSKPTGHLGSSVLKKAETVCFVEKDNNTVMVKSEYTRNYPFEDFSFSLNNDYLPTETEQF